MKYWTCGQRGINHCIEHTGNHFGNAYAEKTCF